MKPALIVLLIFTVLATAVISIKQPKMHSKILVYDSQYSIVDNNKDTVEEVFTVEEMPTMPADNTETKVETFFDKNVKNVPVQEVKVVKKDVTPNQKVNVIPVEKSVNVAKNVEPKTVAIKNETKPNISTTTVNQQPQQKVNEVGQTVQQKPVTTVKPQQKVLTEQEELIAWNKWRSNLQNQIMKDSKLPIMPMGTIFKMTFDVDKSGRVSNIQTWSTNPKYTPYAIEYIAPVIKSYQGKSILDFPAGSQRQETTFSGGWKISQSQRYSTPENYNDIEKVTK